MFCFEQIVWSPLQGVILLLSKPGGRRWGDHCAKPRYPIAEPFG